ncbi:MAG: fatty acid desaturase [Aquisalinus sp.]|nr:fatty acid desaturase [Aquisalinus sp.]
MSSTVPTSNRHFKADLIRSDTRSVMYLAFAIISYIVSLVVIVSDVHWAFRLLSVLLHTIAITVFFTIGHDCVHNAFFKRRFMNRWAGRFAFGFLFHSSSLWKQVHNINHHGRTNLKGVDDVWAPFSPDEFRALPKWRQWLERIYRGPFGHLIYYQCQYLFPKVMLPLQVETRRHWRKHFFDSCFVIIFGALLITLTLGLKATLNPEGSLWLALILAGVVPFVLWNALLSFTIYVQHTNPDVHWFNKLEDWSHHNGHVRGTVDTLLPAGFIPLYTDVMRHTAHHDDPTIPVYALSAAQELLNARHGHDITQLKVSWRAYWNVVRACKLYDYNQRCWTDFEGEPTSTTYYERFNISAEELNEGTQGQNAATSP